MRRLLKPVSAVLATVAGGALVYGLEVHVWGDDIPLWVYLAVAASCGTLSWWLFHVAEHGRWGRKRQVVPQKWFEALASEMERLAESLQQERLDRGGEDVTLLNRNRIALTEIAKKLEERSVPHPDPRSPHGETEEWETFLWGFIHRANAGDAHTLPTLCEDVRKAFEQRDYWMDAENVIRHFQEKGLLK